MTTPNGDEPDDFRSYESLSGLQDEEEPGKGSIHGAAEDVRGAFGDAIENILGSVGELIGAGLEAAGFVISSVIDGIADAISALTDGLKALIGGDSSGFDSDSDLADIADGQRELLKLPDQLEDNAGFFSYTMDRNWGLTKGNRWYSVAYNERITQEKNAELAAVTYWKPFFGSGEPVDWSSFRNADELIYGVWIHGQGVWDIQSVVTIEPNSSSNFYFEHDILILRCSTRGSTTTLNSGLQVPNLTAREIYSTTRMTGWTAHNRIRGSFAPKRVLIPDDDHEYFAMARMRWETARNGRKLWGGYVWSSFNGTRQSIDTEDHTPTDETDSSDGDDD